MTETLKPEINLELIVYKLDELKATVNELKTTVKQQITEDDKRYVKYDDRLKKVEIDVAQIQTKQTTLAYVQGVLSVFLSSLGAWLGIRF